MTPDYMVIVGYIVVSLLLISKIPKIVRVFFTSMFEEFSIVMKKYHELFPPEEKKLDREDRLQLVGSYHHGSGDIE